MLTDFFRKDKKSQEFNKEDYEAGINQDVNSPEYQRNPELTREEKIDRLKKAIEYCNRDCFRIVSFSLCGTI